MYNKLNYKNTQNSLASPLKTLFNYSNVVNISA